MPMIVFPDVPQSLSRDRYREIVALLGLDVDDCESMRLEPEGVFVTLYGRDPDGQTLVVGDFAVRHEAFIPVDV